MQKTAIQFNHQWSNLKFKRMEIPIIQESHIFRTSFYTKILSCEITKNQLILLEVFAWYFCQHFINSQLRNLFAYPINIFYELSVDFFWFLKITELTSHPPTICRENQKHLHKSFFQYFLKKILFCTPTQVIQ
jgi:hypothetical protein